MILAHPTMYYWYYYIEPLSNKKYSAINIIWGQTEAARNLTKKIILFGKSCQFQKGAAWWSTPTGGGASKIWKNPANPAGSRGI